ncbi:MAG: ATP-binding protein [Pseudomonadota bacterium]
MTAPILHMLCGKIASGKSTLARDLARLPGTVRLAEDDWLAALFQGDMASIRDYMQRAARLRGVLGPHVVDLLNAGVSVVLDFQANTVESRAWMRDILNQTGADHRLHVLTTPDALCLARLRARNETGSHPFAPTEAQFHSLSAHFALPTQEEGFHVVRHAVPDGRDRDAD